MNEVEIIKPINKSKVSDEVTELKRYFADRWWSSNKELPNLGQKTDYWYKRRKEKETNKFIKQFIRMIKQFSEVEDECNIWKENIRDLIDNFIKGSDLISGQDREILFNNDLFQSTEKFVYEARKFDSTIKVEDIGQAMRNVWIMNIIQLLFGKKVQYTPSIFGYSMLYPYTDNYLDNTEISREEKNEIGIRFEKRLKGESIEPKNKYEENLFRLVTRIESEYERSSYPHVYESLLSIHKAQAKSLQQQGKKTGPYEEDILGISIEKGGTSVLADAYLVNGKLTQKEANFFFGYGVLLQICDDLQDAKNDLENDHMTIVSQLSEKWPLDNITNGLINFTFEIIEKTQCFSCSNIEDLKELIRKNCLQLILFSVAQNRNLYSRKYYNQIKQYFPYRDRYMTKAYNRIKKKYSKLKKSYNGVKTEVIITSALNQVMKEKELV